MVNVKQKKALFFERITKYLAKSIIGIYWATNGISSIVKYALYYMMPRLKVEHRLYEKYFEENK